jgi:hypothetical protein
MEGSRTRRMQAYRHMKILLEKIGAPRSVFCLGVRTALNKSSGNRISALARPLALCMMTLLLCISQAAGQTPATDESDTAAPAPLFRSAEDGWLDVSGFLDTKYGFLPIVIPITEPAVGYGAAAGMAFISEPFGSGRPDITVVGGLGTENGTRGALVGDSRNWLGGRLQTLAGFVYASVNLDFYGIGEDSVLEDQPLSYTLEPTGGLLQSKYRIGDSDFWAGLSYAFASTEVTIDAPADTPRLPDHRSESNISGIGPSLTFDTRDNIFTPTRGTYAEVMAGLFREALGGDDDFQRVQIIAMQFTPLYPGLYLGLRGQAYASSDETPFYMRPFIFMRGVPAMHYQGEEMAQIEAELRWQLWRRFSVVGFAGCGAAWNDLERVEDKRSATAGGIGIRYEIARTYGIHMGMDVAYGLDGTAIYIQFGSAWVRP